MKIKYSYIKCLLQNLFSVLVVKDKYQQIQRDQVIIIKYFFNLIIISICMGGSSSDQNNNFFQMADQLRSLQFNINKLTQENSSYKQNFAKLSSQYNQASKKIQQLNDPKLIEENQEKLFKNFIDSLQTFNVYNPLPKKENFIFVAVIGMITAGKTSIYNRIFKKNLKVGQQQTTEHIQEVQVDKIRKRCYYDSPGLSQHMSLVNAHLLKAFYGIQSIFIIEDRSFKSSKKCIRILDKINPPQLFLVRTKCDLIKDHQLQQVMTDDRNLLEKWGIKREILYISMQRPENYLDNRRFQQLLLGYA